MQLVSMRRAAAPLLPLLAAVAAVAAIACSGDDGERANGDAATLRVVASTAIIADLASHVAGPDAEVSAVIPAGADVHGFSASPDVARRIAEADVVLVNGYRLEESTLDLILENRADDALLVVVSAGLEALAGGHDHDDEEHEDDDHADEEHDEDAHEDEEHADLATAEGDPHLWLSVPNAMTYVRNIADALSEADPDHTSAYRDRADAYLEELETLDSEVRATVDAIPEDRRVLVVFHDAFQYFAAEYGLDLAAAVLPASASQQASAAQIAAITELVDERGVAAVYREPQFAASALDTIASETGARVLTLYSGTFDEGVDSYVALMRANASALAEGLGE